MILQGREAEQRYLHNYYEKSGSQMLIVYGHKNIGKTTLLLEFSKDKPHYYYMARNCSEREQRYCWGRELRERNINIGDYPSFQAILENLSISGEGKRVLIIDEFQYMVKGGGSFLQELIPLLRGAGDGSGVLILLCSSLTGWVENSMLSRLGRAAYELSGFLKVKEAKFDALQSYFQGYTLAQAVETYGILGGIPGLWRYFSRNLSTMDNVCQSILAQDSKLTAAACGYVSGELRETGVYYTILASIASGRHKLNDLYVHTGFSRAKISVYLKNLMQLEIVEKVFSYDTPGRENTQKGIYRICNSLVSFYFKYIYPNQSALAYMDKEIFYDTYIKPTFKEFTARAYRKVCAQYLETENQNQGLPFVYEKSGEWIGKTGNIDIIAQDGGGSTLIGLCNWEMPRMSYPDYEWLLFNRDKAKVRADIVYLFSENGFDKALQEEAVRNRSLRLITLTSK